ncbi:MAG: hypothetical protein ACREP5_18275, partial [Candidatus Binatia bacterium]
MKFIAPASWISSIDDGCEEVLTTKGSVREIRKQSDSRFNRKERKGRKKESALVRAGIKPPVHENLRVLRDLRGV